MMTLRTEADLSMHAARVRLCAPSRPGAALPALGAAALAALSGMALACAVILGPPGMAHDRPAFAATTSTPG